MAMRRIGGGGGGRQEAINVPGCTNAESPIGTACSVTATAVASGLFTCTKE